MIVITGGAGFIGSVLVWKLNELGHEDLIVVDKEARGTPKWKNLTKRQYREYYDHEDFLKRLEGGRFKKTIQAIFHMGAITDTTERDDELLMRENFQYSRRLAEWAVKEEVQLLYASSAATYGGGELGYSDEDKLTPRLKPLNPYGRSKQRFDLWVLEHEYENRVTGFKFFNVFGPNEYHKGEMRSMVHKGFGQIKEGGKIRLFQSHRPDFEDGGQKRDFVYVKDAVDAVAWFWMHPEVRGIYNIGTGRARTWNDLARALFAVMGKKECIEYFPMPDELSSQYQYRTEADLTKLKRAGCPVEFHELEESVRDYVTGYLSKKDTYL